METPRILHKSFWVSVSAGIHTLGGLPLPKKTVPFSNSIFQSPPSLPLTPSSFSLSSSSELTEAHLDFHLKVLALALISGPKSTTVPLPKISKRRDKTILRSKNRHFRSFRVNYQIINIKDYTPKINF